MVGPGSGFLDGGTRNRSFRWWDPDLVNPSPPDPQLVDAYNISSILSNNNDTIIDHHIYIYMFGYMYMYNTIDTHFLHILWGEKTKN